MTKATVGVAAGLAVWASVTTAAGLIMRASWPAYAAVADAMTFTLPMMLARLAIGALATLAMGLATSIVVRRSSAAPLAAGILLLLAFIPVHISLWERFPIWYHLTFLLSLVPLSVVGGRISRLSADGRLSAHRPRHAAGRF
jgi:hypothetical protein